MSGKNELWKLFHVQLSHMLIKLDEAESKSEIKRIGRANIYRMGILLKAMHEAEEEAEKYVDDGVPVKEAFIMAVTSHFTPTRRMHTFLKKIDPSVDVKYGSWVWKK